MIKRAGWLLLLVALLTVADVQTASAAQGTAPGMSREEFLLRYERANLTDLLGRLRARRARLKSVWGQVVLTREIVRVALELERVQTRLDAYEEPPA